MGSKSSVLSMTIKIFSSKRSSVNTLMIVSISMFLSKILKKLVHTYGKSSGAGSDIGMPQYHVLVRSLGGVSIWNTIL